jgi:hypothetical protein
MQELDVVKLFYQRYLGCEHLVKDANYSYTYLLDEIKEVKKSEFPFIEDIGDDFVRVYLEGLLFRNIDLKFFNSLFVKSSLSFVPKLEEFKEKLKLEVSSEFLKNYNYEPVHHSKIYRDVYLPHYRVIKKEFIELLLKGI